MNLPELMPAWQATAFGPPEEVLVLAEVPVPRPRPGQVLVEMWTAALGFQDALLTAGAHQEHPPLPFTPGTELCGEIVAVGPGVDRLRLGERVVGTTSLPHGALARFAVAEADAVLQAPNRLDDASAAGFHVAYQVGWFGLYRRAALRVGETLLVHAAAGGLGSAAVQLGKAAGARVIGVVGGSEKADAARLLGVDVIVDRTRQDVVEAVLAATDGLGADVIYDPVGGVAFEASTQLVAFEGRIVVIGFASGQMARLSTNHTVTKNYSVHGVNWSSYQTRAPDLVRRAHADLTRLVDAGAIMPLTVERVSFGEVAESMADVGRGLTLGRVVVRAPLVD